MDAAQQAKQEPPKKKKIKSGKSIFVNVQNTKYLTVRHCMKDLGFKFTESTTKNLLFWCDSEGTIEFTKSLQRWQFYNHFPGMLCIAHKVDFVRLYNKLSRKLPDIYNFLPKSFVIPIEFQDLQNYMNSIPKKADRTVIVKPDRGSQGKGILIIQDFDDLDDYMDSAVAQYYIPPYLLNGKKFDMRIYVLVTSCDPLRAYILNEGMMRFCTEDYQSPKASNLDEVYAHLTNFSLNKKNSAFDFNENKKYMTAVFLELHQNGVDIEKVQREIDRIIRLTLIAAQPTLASNYHIAVNANDGKSRCFEILGFDILLDKNAHPWLLEVNCMPSLASYSEFDSHLKSRVISGTLKILDLQPNFKNKCIQRFKAMSMRGTNSFKPIFSPETESEIAKTTDWRQLIPVIDDPEMESICQTAAFGANDNTTLIRNDSIKLRLKPTEKKPSKSKSRPLTASKSSSTINTARNQIRSNQQKPTKIENANSAVNKNPPISSTDFSPKKPAQLARPKTSSTTRLQQVRTPRSVILANEARMNRMNALDKRNNFNESLPIYAVFGATNTCPIIEIEERERIRSLQKQAQLCSSVSMFQAIKALICDRKGDNSAPSSSIVPKTINQSPKRPQLILDASSAIGKKPLIKVHSSLIPVIGIQCL